VRPQLPAVQQILELPSLITLAASPTWEDYNGHVNIRYYMSMYEQASQPLIESWGVDQSYFSERRLGIFDLEHHLHYLAEIHVGDSVAVHHRLLGRTLKRFHGMFFAVNTSRQQLASTLEYVTSGADLGTRSMAALPADLAERLDRQLAEHSRLAWPAPVCGIMSA
jgi:acyl-CoA thioester hydrolase